METPDPEREIDEFIMFNEVVEKIKLGETVPQQLVEVVDILKKSEVDMNSLMENIDSDKTPNIIELLKDRISNIKKFSITTDNDIVIDISFNKPKNVEMTIVYAIDKDGNRIWFDKISNENTVNTTIYI
jgi:nitrous oxide reductase